MSANISTNASGTNTFPRRGRPRLICFSNCRNVRITNLHLQQQAVWCLHLLYCRNVVVDNLDIRALQYIPSSDGIDVDSSRDVKISRCNISCYDDDIAIKSGKDGRAAGEPAVGEHHHQRLHDWLGRGLTMGLEVSGSIRHVLVRRCKFIGTGSAARIKPQPSRGGVIEDITWRDIQLNNTVRRSISTWSGGWSAHCAAGQSPDRGPEPAAHQLPARRSPAAHARHERQPDSGRQIQELQRDGAARLVLGNVKDPTFGLHSRSAGEPIIRRDAAARSRRSSRKRDK